MDLYHATPFATAILIVDSGFLRPMSRGLNEPPHLCMSASLKGAVTLESRANDIIFKLPEESVVIADFELRGAGERE